MSQIRHTTVLLLLLGMAVFAVPLSTAAADTGVFDSPSADSVLVRIEGTVESRPEDTPIGTWVVAEQTVRVLESTRIDETHGPAVVGASVVVLAKPLDATRAAVAAYQAVAIHVLPSTDVVSRIVVIRGRVTELETTYLVVNDLKVLYDRLTQIDGHLVLGAFVQIRAERVVWEFRALTIRVLPTNDQIVEFEGVIERIGHWEWVIAGRRVQVTRETTIIGRPEVGLTAKVRARLEPSGELTALLVAVTNEWPVVVEWSGPIERLPPQASTQPDFWEGLWIVGGRRVLVIGNTEIEGRPRVGLQAHVVALSYPWRLLVAKQVSVLSVVPVEPLEATP